MALTFRTPTTSSTAAAASLTVNVPTGTTDGDLLFLVAYNYGAYDITSGLGVFSLLAEDRNNTDRYSVYYKVASGEPASYTILYSGGSGNEILLVMMCYYGASWSSSSPVQISNTQYRSSNTINIAGTMINDYINSPMFFFGGVYSTTSKTQTKPSVPTTDWVENYDSGDTTCDLWVEVCSMVWSGSGSTGVIASTLSALTTTKHAIATSFYPVGTYPTVTTSSVDTITADTAITYGNATFDGYTGLIEVGICWSTTTGPTIAGSHATNGSSTGAYSIHLVDLTPGTLYYFNAYATTSYGTSYGTQSTFTTLVRPSLTGISTSTGINTLTF